MFRAMSMPLRRLGPRSEGSLGEPRSSLGQVVTTMPWSFKLFFGPRLTRLPCMRLAKSADGLFTNHAGFADRGFLNDCFPRHGVKCLSKRGFVAVNGSGSWGTEGSRTWSLAPCPKL